MTHPFDYQLQQAFVEDWARAAEQQRQVAAAGRSVTDDPWSAQFCVPSRSVCEVLASGWPSFTSRSPEALPEATLDGGFTGDASSSSLNDDKATRPRSLAAALHSPWTAQFGGEIPSEISKHFPALAWRPA